MSWDSGSEASVGSTPQARVPGLGHRDKKRIGELGFPILFYFLSGTRPHMRKRVLIAHVTLRSWPQYHKIMAMLEMARTTTGWTKNTSCASTTSAMKNSANVPIAVNLTISLKDVTTLCSILTAPGFARQVSWRLAHENIERQKAITEMTESSGLLTNVSKTEPMMTRITETIKTSSAIMFTAAGSRFFVAFACSREGVTVECSCTFPS
jgi:hypothetical protein